jgi:hypothetical protein
MYQPESNWIWSRLVNDTSANRRTVSRIRRGLFGAVALNAYTNGFAMRFKSSPYRHANILGMDRCCGIQRLFVERWISFVHN